jgi:hypothetical protein
MDSGEFIEKVKDKVVEIKQTVSELDKEATQEQPDETVKSEGSVEPQTPCKEEGGEGGGGSGDKDVTVTPDALGIGTGQETPGGKE